MIPAILAAGVYGYVGGAVATLAWAGDMARGRIRLTAVALLWPLYIASCGQWGDNQ